MIWTIYAIILYYLRLLTIAFLAGPVESENEGPDGTGVGGRGWGGGGDFGRCFDGRQQHRHRCAAGHIVTVSPAPRHCQPRPLAGRQVRHIRLPNILKIIKTRLLFENRPALYFCNYKENKKNNMRMLDTLFIEGFIDSMEEYFHF